MKYLKSIIAIFIINFLLLNTSFAQNQAGEYCNPRFNFCIEYPSDIFTEKMLSTNGDGIELTNDNGDVYLFASGSNNILTTSVEAEYKNFLNYMVATEGQVKELETNRVGNMLEVSIQNGKKYFFYRTYISDNYLVAVLIKTDLEDPTASLAAFNYLKSIVKLDAPDIQNGTAGL